MKRLLLFPLVLILTSCGYGSLYEARNACNDWARDRNGSTYDFYYDCEEEQQTNQVLGYQENNALEVKVLKRFRY
tara:strand:+ start:1033 stop:1257 length:225 start_codon:yes stop_codon:yes gene_type:complete